MTSETTEGPGTGAPDEGGVAATERFTHVLTPANETAPPPPPEAANSDVAGESEVDLEVEAEAAAEAEAGSAAAQEWPLAWLRLVEPEPPATDDEVVAAVIAAEPADADGVAHAFGAADAEPAARAVGPAEAEASAQAFCVADAEEDARAFGAGGADGVVRAFGRVMAAALDPEPVFAAEEEEFVETAGSAFYSVPVVEPLEEAAGAGSDGLAAPDAKGDAQAARGERSSAAGAEENVVSEPEEPPFVTPIYAARRAAARRAEAETEGQAGEGGPAAAAYLFYLAGFLLLPAVVGVLIAYNARRTAPAWLQSHYLFLIRTFWIGFAGTAVSAALLFSGKLTLAGLVLGLLLIGWLEMRSAIGFISLEKLHALRRPRSWLL